MVWDCYGQTPFYKRITDAKFALERFRLDIVLLIYSMTLVQSIAAGALRSLNENSLVEMELPGWLTSTAVCHQGEHVFESCYDLSKKSRL